MTINLDGAIDRVVVNEVAALNALSTPVPSDAVPYFVYWQEEFPYWTNRVGQMQMADLGEEFDRPTYTIIMRLVIAHWTQDYDGFNEDKLKTWIPQVITYFHQRPRLQTTANTTGLTDIEEARIVSCTGLRAFQSGGVQATQIGVEFQLRCSFYETINLAYG